MQNTIERNATAELAELVYKNSKMGGEAITDILPKIKDEGATEKCEKLRAELTRQFAEYEKIAAEAEKHLEKNDLPATEEGVLTKMASKLGIMMNTMKDPSPSHIAEMTVKGLSMGITEMIAQKREAEKRGCDDEILKLAERLISFQEEAVDKIKAYL